MKIARLFNIILLVVEFLSAVGFTVAYLLVRSEVFRAIAMSSILMSFYELGWVMGNVCNE